MKITHYLRKLDEIELASLFLLVVGFILSLSTGSAVMYYIVALLAGVFFGRIWYQTRSQPQFKYFLLMTFFMIGFVAGNIFSPYGDARITVGMYLLGIIVGYMMHHTRIQKTAHNGRAQHVGGATVSEVRSRKKY